jgi:hypothetical protein
MPIESDDGRSGGPICPNCREPLRGNLCKEQLHAQGASEGEPQSRVGVTYCGACGWTLHVEAHAPAMAAGGRRGAALAAPPDESTPEGQFQLRCRELIAEIRARGFDPFVWVGLINDLGAVRAAKTILADHEVLPVTSWLAARGLPELTLEGEVGQPRWADVFDESDRTRAGRRLASATGQGPHR